MRLQLWRGKYLQLALMPRCFCKSMAKRARLKSFSSGAARTTLKEGPLRSLRCVNMCVVLNSRCQISESTVFISWVHKNYSGDVLFKEAFFFLCLIYLATELLHLLLPFNGTFKPNFEHTIKICSGCPVNDAVELLWRRWNRRLQVHLECLVLQTSFKGATKQTHTSTGTFVPTDQ